LLATLSKVLELLDIVTYWEDWLDTFTFW
jgi:hypothetical protein